jgi:isopenicillin N synthase-like dioxygenase
MGDCLAKMSNNLIKATRHRVLDIGSERYSMPYFMTPKHSARISPLHLQSRRQSAEDLDYEKNEDN